MLNWNENYRHNLENEPSEDWMVGTTFRRFKSPIKKALYKDIGKHSNSKVKINALLNNSS